ncbi:poly(A)+ RNA export protein, putative [Eimeria praecox]|uniref:Poly(A)+ RNA export protein, putative n=1 Tax=Eimeria praecox TaxID=51316 RepID=U6GZ57_9EIME|nr:poly(A)+ RNA export protein, putative [Eimeria praecox]
MAFGFGRSTTESANYYSKQNSTELPNGPSDSVSQLAWSRDGKALACASWDRTCRVWQITTQPAAFGTNGQVIYKGNPQSLFTETAPILSCCFGDTTQMLLTAGCDKQVKAYDLISGRTTGQVIGQVRRTPWLEYRTSWDGGVKMWDGKQPNPVWQQNVGAKGQTAFAVNTPSAAAAASLPVITKLGSNYQKMQTRSIAFFPDDASQSPGVAIGSVEGRCSILFIKESQRPMDFSYRCHRQEVQQQQLQIFSVNAISFSKLKSFSTGGSDGVIICWDKESRQKLKTFEPAGAPIADLKYDPTSLALAYAGPDQQELAKGHHVYIHAMKEEDIRPRPKNTQRR